MRTADQRAQAGQQLFHVKRFGQVIVGTGVNAGHFFVPLVTRREDQHRHGLTLPAPALEHADAVQLGQAEVQHHGVIGLGFALVAGVTPIQGGVHGIARVSERRAQLRGQSGFVFSDQDAHQGPLDFCRNTSPLRASSSSLSKPPPGCNSLISYSQRPSLRSSSTSST